MLSSTAGAAEYRGPFLGEYLEAGEKYGERPYYIQKDTEGAKPRYLYFEDNCWQVSETLGNRNDYIKNCQNTTLPPIGNTGWEYVAGDGAVVPWNNTDTSLTLKFTSLSPCPLVKVVLAGDAQRQQGLSFGHYWSRNIVVLNITANYQHPKKFKLQN